MADRQSMTVGAREMREAPLSVERSVFRNGGKSTMRSHDTLVVDVDVRRMEDAVSRPNGASYDSPGQRPGNRFA